MLLPLGDSHFSAPPAFVEEARAHVVAGLAMQHPGLRKTHVHRFFARVMATYSGALFFHAGVLFLRILVRNNPSSRPVMNTA